LLLCFAALALRAVLFAVVSNPYLVVAVQVLDGVCAAVLGVILPLVVADVMRGTGRFNLGLGIVGSAVGIGAALSTTLAGFMMDRFGSSLAFWSLAGVAVCGLALVWLLLPETRPESAPTQRCRNFVIKRGGLRRPGCWYATDWERCARPRYFSAFAAVTYRTGLNFNQVPGKPGACSRVATQHKRIWTGVQST
jgi:MFS family permease